MTANSLQRINICMLLELQYAEKMNIYPTHEILSYIINFGHDVTWVLSSEEIKEVLETTFNDVRVFVVPCKYCGGLFKVVTRALNVVKRMRFVLKNFKDERYNMILVRNDVFDAFLALYIKRRYKIPFVFEKDNPIEQSWETRKFYSKHKYFCYFSTKINAYLTMQIMHKADLVLPISKWLKDDFVKKGIERRKMMTFPEGIYPNRFLDRNEKEIRKREGLEDSKAVIYIGTMDKMRHLDVLIHAFSKVRAGKKVKLLLVGDGTDKPNLERLASELGIDDDVVFTGRIPFEEVPNFIAVANVGVSAVPPLDIYKLSSPIKILEYMAMAKPVVANEEIPDHKEIVEESGGGILVKFEAESFAEGIIELLNNPARAEEMGRMGRKWVVKNRSYEILARRLEERYLKLIATEEE
jgi:glycosyltransferase involved in cell wall biosynthesis